MRPGRTRSGTSRSGVSPRLTRTRSWGCRTLRRGRQPDGKRRTGGQRREAHGPGCHAASGDLRQARHAARRMLRCTEQGGSGGQRAQGDRPAHRVIVDAVGDFHVPSLQGACSPYPLEALGNAGRDSASSSTGVRASTRATAWRDTRGDRGRARWPGPWTIMFQRSTP